MTCQKINIFIAVVKMFYSFDISDIHKNPKYSLHLKEHIYFDISRQICSVQKELPTVILVK